jgi:hypothetical protein
MPSIACAAGHVFSIGLIPDPNSYTLISDARVGDAAEKIAEGSASHDDVEVSAGFLIRSFGMTAYKCPSCARLILFELGANMPPTSYVKE